MQKSDNQLDVNLAVLNQIEDMQINKASKYTHGHLEGSNLEDDIDLISKKLQKFHISTPEKLILVDVKDTMSEPSKPLNDFKRCEVSTLHVNVCDECYGKIPVLTKILKQDSFVQTEAFFQVSSDSLGIRGR